MKYKNGTVYCGSWKDGKMNGDGVLNNKSTKYVGKFKDGKLNGIGY
jgi:hypothetical protein